MRKHAKLFNKVMNSIIIIDKEYLTLLLFMEVVRDQVNGLNFRCYDITIKGEDYFKIHFEKNVHTKDIVNYINLNQ
jgi:hypothetical protein